MAEVRTWREGLLMWVAASGVGSTWGTAATPQSGIVGFVQSMSLKSAMTVEVISERGTPNHNKVVELLPPELDIEFMWTGYHPTGVSGAGASVPMVHLEYKSLVAEAPGTARYLQFMGVPLSSFDFTEDKKGNKLKLTSKALAMIGPTASGYLS